ncbi:MAG: AzlD domain-containing protein [Thiothrix sp.]|nr:AzlD domain-containing protein [Thiothrix sp.]HPQ97656.1 AzlD domain-containing protein [Thiolinea sp.]
MKYTDPEILAIILGMASVTYGIRFVLYARAHRTHIPDWLEAALKFVPVAVLTAIISPMILMPEQHFSLDWHNPWLLGAAAAFGAGFWKQQPLLTILAGVVVFFTARSLLP